MGSTRLFVSILLALIWICDGMVINLLQLLLRLTVRPFNPVLFRKLNYYLIYTSWSQLVAMGEHWGNCRLTIHYADEQSRRLFGKEHCLTLMNHRYEVDWLYCWMVMDKFGCLAVSILNCYEPLCLFMFLCGMSLP
jgi:lysophosphatidic acid acyltransferase/lysophosphatidylinositol acyltransferase